MNLYRCLILACSLFVMNFCYADLSVTVKPQPAYVNQELTLIIRQQGNRAPAKLPDLSMLGMDFQIVGSQQSMSYQNYNGQILRENIWTIILIPKYSGQFTIPSFSLGGETSAPQNIEVLPLQSFNSSQAQAKVDVTPGVYMQWDFEPKQAHVHQQIKIKVQIYHSTPLMDAKLSSPQVENALLFNLDEPSHQLETVKGRRYEVETYEYLLFPQKEGELKIQPPVLDALEYEFMPNPIHIKLPPRTMEVLPSQAQALKDLRLKILKSGDGAQAIELGDTLTREFELEAQGLPYQMMPSFTASCGKDCKVYVQNTENKNLIRGGDVIGRQRFSVSYLPQKSGQFTIHEIVIPWFNTQTQKAEQLKIPGMKLRIQSSSMKTEEAGPTQANTALQKQGVSKVMPNWLLILLGMIAGMGLMQGLKSLSWSKIREKMKSCTQIHSPIKEACQQNSAIQLRSHLLAWAKKQFPEAVIHDLHDICALEIKPEFKTALNELIKHLYGNNQPQHPWDGQEFWQIFSKFGKGKKNKLVENIIRNRLNPH